MDAGDDRGECDHDDGADRVPDVLEDGGDECPSGLPDLLDLAHGLGDECGDGLQDWLACGADLVPDSHEPCGEAVPESFAGFGLGEEPCQRGDDRADGYDKHADRIRIQGRMPAARR